MFGLVFIGGCLRNRTRLLLLLFFERNEFSTEDDVIGWRHLGAEITEELKEVGGFGA